MKILYGILILIGCLLIGYLCGSVSFGTIVGKKIYHKDIRQYGSNNAGATNAGRVLGKKAGILVAVFDILKVIIPLWSIYLLITLTSLKDYCLLSPAVAYYSVSLGSLLGHCYPVFYGFKGGKAVSTMAGIIAATNWLITILAIILFFTILKLKKYVSLASMVSALFVFSSSLLLFINALHFTMWANMEPGFYFSIFLGIEAAILIFRHRANIARLREGNERKISWMK